MRYIYIARYICMWVYLNSTKSNEKKVFHYVKLTYQLLFKARFPNKMDRHMQGTNARYICLKHIDWLQHVSKHKLHCINVTKHGMHCKSDKTAMKKNNTSQKRKWHGIASASISAKEIPIWLHLGCFRTLAELHKLVFGLWVVSLW